MHTTGMCVTIYILNAATSECKMFGISSPENSVNVHYAINCGVNISVTPHTLTHSHEIPAFQTGVRH